MNVAKIRIKKLIPCDLCCSVCASSLIVDFHYSNLSEQENANHTILLDLRYKYNYMRFSSKNNSWWQDKR